MIDNKIHWRRVIVKIDGYMSIANSCGEEISRKILHMFRGFVPKN